MSTHFFDQPPAQPLAWLETWLAEARHCDLNEPMAMNLATAEPDGRPSSRIVLYKGMRGEDLCFYTNYRSRKGEQLAKNQWIALCFWWDPLMRQLRIEGHAERLPEDQSDAYFAGRPRGSQLGAWASDQSQPAPSRESLEQQFRAVEERFPTPMAVPRPPHWGGYRVRIERMEFWLGRENRFHDRVEYRRSESGWTMDRLQP